MSKSIYVAGGWFDAEQESTLKSVIKALNQNPTIDTLFIPMEHQAQAEEFSLEWQDLTFKSDIAGIQNTDLVLATLTTKQDTGTIWEMGYAYGIHKPVLTYISTNSLNLMPVKGTLAFIQDINELETIDFNLLPANTWHGGVQ